MAKLGGVAKARFDALHPRGPDGRFIKRGAAAAALGAGAPGRRRNTSLPGIRGAAQAIQQLRPPAAPRATADRDDPHFRDRVRQATGTARANQVAGVRNNHVRGLGQVGAELREIADAGADADQLKKRARVIRSQVESGIGATPDPVMLDDIAAMLRDIDTASTVDQVLAAVDRHLRRQGVELVGRPGEDTRLDLDTHAMVGGQLPSDRGRAVHVIRPGVRDAISGRLLERAQVAPAAAPAPASAAARLRGMSRDDAAREIDRMPIGARNALLGELGVKVPARMPNEGKKQRALDKLFPPAPAASQPTAERFDTPVGRAIAQAYADARAARDTRDIVTGTGDLVRLADIRDALDGRFTRAEIDAELRRLNRAPAAGGMAGFKLFPQSNQKILTQRERNAAIDIGGYQTHNLQIQGELPPPQAAARTTPTVRADSPPESHVAVPDRVLDATPAPAPTATPSRMTKAQYTKLLKEEHVRLQMLGGASEKEAKAAARPAATIDELKERNAALRRQLRASGVDHRTDEQKRADDAEKNRLLDEVQRLATEQGFDGESKRAAVAKMTVPEIRKFLDDVRQYQRRQAEKARAAREGAAARAEAERRAQVSGSATDRQVDYIMSLLVRRRRDGEGGGFFNGPTDLAGVKKLSQADASAYIDSLRGDY